MRDGQWKHEVEEMNSERRSEGEPRQKRKGGAFIVEVDADRRQWNKIGVEA
jgi:hypothetical protein